MTGYQALVALRKRAAERRREDDGADGALRRSRSRARERVASRRRHQGAGDGNAFTTGAARELDATRGGDDALTAQSSPADDPLGLAR